MPCMDRPYASNRMKLDAIGIALSAERDHKRLIESNNLSINGRKTLF